MIINQSIDDNSNDLCGYVKVTQQLTIINLFLIYIYINNNRKNIFDNTHKNRKNVAF